MPPVEDGLAKFDCGLALGALIGGLTFIMGAPGPSLYFDIAAWGALCALAYLSLRLVGWTFLPVKRGP